MNRLERDHPFIIAQNILLNSLPGLAEERLRIRLSFTVLIHYLGEECTNDLFGKPEDVTRRGREGRRYLGTDSIDHKDRYRLQSRVEWLAERLFNLQDIEGIERLVEEIKQGHLESRFAELDCAAQLKQYGIPFRFLRPSSVPGHKTPDLEIICPSGGVIPCEIEGKKENTLLTIQTIVTTLDHARKQLPKGTPGLIILKIPEEWVRQEKISEAFRDSLHQFFRNTERVVAVIVRWEEVLLQADGAAAVLTKYRVEATHRKELVSSDVAALLTILTNPRSGSWVSFHEVVIHSLAAHSMRVISQKVDLVEEALGTGVFVVRVKKGEVEFTQPIQATAVNVPLLQVAITLNPNTNDSSVLLGLADGTPPLSVGIFDLPKDFSSAPIHEFKLYFENWQIISLELDGDCLRRK